MRIPQPPVASEKDPAPRLTYIQSEMDGAFTASTRVGVPKNKVYNLENIIPVGPQNNQIVPNIGPLLFDYGGDTITWTQSFSISTQFSPANTFEFIFAASVGGNLYRSTLGVTNASGWNPNSPPIPTTSVLSGLTSPRMAQWARNIVLIIDKSGFYSYDSVGAPVHITGPGVPAQGDDIAVFAGRVWIVSGQTVFVSGPGDYSAASWLPANGAFFFGFTDPPLRSTVQRMMSANGLLYIFSTSGVNVISNVQIVPGSVPPLTNFQNTVIQSIIGTDQPASVVPYDRFIAFANRYGCYTMYGIAAPKISDDINGTWQYLDFSQVITAGQCVVAGILCLAFLVKRLNDPIFGNNTVIALWFERGEQSVWWFANYGALSNIVSAQYNAQPSLFGILNNQLYQLFADPTTYPNTQVMTALYSGEDPLAKKEALTFGFEVNFLNSAGTISATIDTDDPDFPSRPILFPQTIAQGVKLMSTGGTNLPSTFNRHIGFTINTTGVGVNYRLIGCDYKIRERWFQFFT